jgi:hypothetical protein
MDAFLAPIAREPKPSSAPRWTVPHNHDPTLSLLPGSNSHTVEGSVADELNGETLQTLPLSRNISKAKQTESEEPRAVPCYRYVKFVMNIIKPC